MDRPQFLEAEAIGAEGGIIYPRLLHLALLQNSRFDAICLDCRRTAKVRFERSGLAVKGAALAPANELASAWFGDFAFARANPFGSGHKPPHAAQQRGDKKGSVRGQIASAY